MSSRSTSLQSPASHNEVAPTGDQVRAQLAARNFGQAEQMAAAASRAAPGDPNLHLLSARAESYLGNAGAAVGELDKAVLTGLQNPAAAFDDPAFDRIRSDPAFVDLRRRTLPQSGAGALKRRPGRRSDLSAGDVEISEAGGHERIRAGDVVLDDRD